MENNIGQDDNHFVILDKKMENNIGQDDNHYVNEKYLEINESESAEQSLANTPKTPSIGSSDKLLPSLMNAQIQPNPNLVFSPIQVLTIESPPSDEDLKQTIGQKESDYLSIETGESEARDSDLINQQTKRYNLIYTPEKKQLIAENNILIPNSVSGLIIDCQKLVGQTFKDPKIIEEDESDESPLDESSLYGDNEDDESSKDSDKMSDSEKSPGFQKLNGLIPNFPSGTPHKKPVAKIIGNPKPLKSHIRIPKPFDSLKIFNKKENPVNSEPNNRLSTNTNNFYHQKFKSVLQKTSAHNNYINLPEKKIVNKNASQNVFSKYIKKTLLPIDEPISYPIDSNIEQLTKKKKNCHDHKIRLNKEIIHDEYNKYSQELRAKLIAELTTPEKEQLSKNEVPNPVEINKRIDQFTRASLNENRVSPVMNYSQNLEEDPEYDIYNKELTKEILLKAPTEKKKKQIVRNDHRGILRQKKFNKIVLDANGNYAPRIRRCPCVKKGKWWEFEGEIRSGWGGPSTTVYHDIRTGPCKDCDSAAQAKIVLNEHAMKIAGERKLTRQEKNLKQKNRLEERRLADLKAKFRKSIPL